MAANKCSAASTSPMAGPAARDQAGQVMSLASAVAHLNTVSAGVSVEPTDYNWGAPSFLQQQALYSQFLQLAFMCSLPQMQYAHLSACPTLQPGRTAMFPGFMPPFSGFFPPATAPCPAQSPAPAPSSPAVPQASGQQHGKSSFARPDALGVKASKPMSPSKKTGGPKVKAAKSASAVNSAPMAPPAGAVKVEPDIELEDICRLLGDDAFLEHLQDDVLSEGSNGSSSTSDGRVLSKNNSNGSLSGSLNNNEGGLFSGNNFASAFDVDMDDAPVAAATAVSEDKAPAPTQAPSKASSGDLNNMVASSPTRLTRSSRTAAREAGGGKDSATKIVLKVNKGGVQKVASSKPSKAQASAASAVPAGTTSQQPSSEECPLTAADLSRLLGEDDNRIPDGWDLDLDFENPFSCSISAF